MIGKKKPSSDASVIKYTEEDGHWIAIIGIDDGNKTLSIADPSNNQITQVTYDLLEYKALNLEGKWWWQNTSYVGDEA